MFDPIDFARQSIKYFSSKDWPTTSELGRVNYVIRGNGLWEVRKNKIGLFFTHLFDEEIGGFPEEEQEEGFELSLPKIPRSILNQTVSFFKSICEEHNFEAYIQIFWDSEKGKYFIECPRQKVSHGRVEYEPHGLDQKYTLVCEIHSHNSMPAFFSQVDDTDEFSRGDRFFGVIGRLDQNTPSMKLSYIMGGKKRVYIGVDSLFEEDSFPKEWLSKISYIDRHSNLELNRSRLTSKDQEDEELEEVDDDEPNDFLWSTYEDQEDIEESRML